jgi:hypothetical protein
VPRHDLQLSPDHAVLISGILIPIRLLINGASMERNTASPTHVELDAHDVVVVGEPSARNLSWYGRRKSEQQHRQQHARHSTGTPVCLAFTSGST